MPDPAVAIDVGPMREDEIEAVREVASTTWWHHYPGIITPAQIEYMLAGRYAPEVIRAEWASGDAWWDVAREAGRVVAFSCCQRDGEAGELKLDKLYVRPDRQRRGLGGRLIAAACARARDLGCPALVLAVNKRNTAAIASYAKHGFRIREAVVKDIGGGFVMDDYVMVREP